MIATMTLLIIAIIAASVMILGNLRTETLQVAEHDVDRHNLTLAGQAERTFQSIELILANISDNLSARGVFNSPSLDVVMGDRDTHQFLQEKLTGLPQLEAITLINAQGKLINFSRYWPIPDVNVSDRDYFHILSKPNSKGSYVGEPVLNRGTGTWNIYVAKKIVGIDGEFSGLILAAISLKYFEDFYASISLGQGSSQALLREDGVLLAIYPRIREVGAKLKSNLNWVSEQPNRSILRELSPVDGKWKIKAARKLATVPLIIMTTQTTDSVLASWYRTVKMVIVFDTGFIVLSIVSVGFVVRSWRQQGMLIKAKAQQAKTEKAKASLETELLREQERNAGAANRAKSSFLAMISHEIRTPMNAVVGLASTLLDTNLDVEQRASVKAIHNAGDGLLDILNDILDFSRLEAGSLALEVVPFRLRSVIAGAMSVIRPNAEMKGLQALSKIELAVPEWVSGDPGRIRQILLNLLSNAIKFTEHGTISLEVSAVSAPGDFVRLDWVITDTGMGIPEDRIGDLFKDFVQVDNSISRRFGGSGLGLSICRRLTEQMGGEIDVSSVVGQGSRFHFSITLPLAAAQPSKHDRPTDSVRLLTEAIERVGHRVRLLVADDSETNRLIIVRMLRDYDVETLQAIDGAEAVEMIASHRPDIVLMDMQMPHLDGIAATLAIRACENSMHRIPIIAYTANAFAEDRETCARAGMTDFLAKPVRKNLLIETLLRALTSKGAWVAVPGTSDEILSAVSASFDASRYTALAEETDEAIARKLLQTFLAEADVKIGSLRDASEIGRASLKNTAHSLKGSASTFGFMETARIAREMEAVGADADEALLRKHVTSMAAAFSLERSELQKQFGVAA